VSLSCRLSDRETAPSWLRLGPCLATCLSPESAGMVRCNPSWSVVNRTAPHRFLNPGPGVRFTPGAHPNRPHARCADATLAGLSSEWASPIGFLLLSRGGVAHGPNMSEPHCATLLMTLGSLGWGLCHYSFPPGTVRTFRVGGDLLRNVRLRWLELYGRAARDCRNGR
jgi:hypothetical protein